MTFDVEKLYALLPSHVRTRDAEQGKPLKAVLSVIAEQVAVVEDDLDQLYDDQFIETCAEWAVPYIGDLVGARGLFVFKNAKFSQRALVANTLKDRRRKGTAASIRSLARNVTQWDASVVEFFQQLATTQYAKHVRTGNLMMPDLRRGAELERIGSPFDPTSRTFEARRVATSRGRYNIPNIGIFLWRIGAYSATAAPPASAGAPHRLLFDVLGREIQLYARREDDPFGVAEPLTRRTLSDDLKQAVDEKKESRYYGVNKSLLIHENNTAVAVDRVRCCNLCDVDSGGWAQQPGGQYLVDPVLGRLLTPAALAANVKVRVTYHYGFSGDIGGGEYPREATFTADLEPIREVQSPASIQSALHALTAGGAVEIQDSETYAETLSIHSPGHQIELRAKDGCRPVLRLAGDATITADPAVLPGGESSVTLNGLTVVGGALVVPAGTALKVLRLRHCTLMPGTEAALVVEEPDCAVEIDSCLLGGIASDGDAIITITNSLVDAGGETRMAYAGTDVEDPGAVLTVENSTLIGQVYARVLRMASNTIFLASANEPDVWDNWPGEAAGPPPVQAERLQDGCVRFSYVPPGSLVPRRHRCQPENAGDDLLVRPVLSSRRFGDAAYGQLDARCAAVIREGADDGAEMGTFHDLFQPQRVANLRTRLDEYLRFGLEAGIFLAS